MSDALTIVLPLKGRLPFTRRWLAYARQFLPYPVLVADGSADQDAAAAAELCRTLKAGGFPVEYARYPYDADLSRFYAKLADAVGRVKTPYVVLADNDDFFAPDGLARALEFLRAHPGHSACGGRFIGFTRDGRGVRFEAAAGTFDLGQPSAAERVRAHFARYHPTWYDVHRTPLLKEAVNALKAADPKDLFLVELWTSFLPLVHGPIGHLPRAYLFRQRDTPSSAAADESARSGYRERAQAPNWEADASRLCADIAAAAAARDGMSDAHALREVRAAFDAYLGATIAAEESSSRRRAPRARLKKTLSASPFGRAALRPLKAATAALRRLSSRPVPVEDRPAAQAVRAFLTQAEKS